MLLSYCGSFFKYLLLIIIVQSVMSDSLWPHGLQHARLPCPAPSPGVCSKSCPLSRWWHTTTSSSVVPFSSCPPSFPASGSFPMSQLFSSGGESIGVLAFSPSNEYTGLTSFRIDWFDLLAVQGTLKSLQHHSLKAFVCLSLGSLNCKLCIWNDVPRDHLVRGWCQCSEKLQHWSRCTFPPGGIFWGDQRQNYIHF